MRRINIIGSGGAGKSTLARRLGALTGLEVLHLDALFWRAGWQETPRPEWRERVARLAARDAWIMDGNFGATLDIRLAAGDTVVYLDFPRPLCLYRVIKRRLKYHNTHRPDMAAGCNEQVNLEFLRWIWRFPTESKPRIEENLQKHAAGKTIFRLHSPREVEEFFVKLEADRLQSV